LLNIARKSNLLVKEEKEKGIWVQDATEVRDIYIDRYTLAIRTKLPKYST